MSRSNSSISSISSLISVLSSLPVETLWVLGVYSVRVELKVPSDVAIVSSEGIRSVVSSVVMKSDSVYQRKDMS